MKKMIRTSMAVMVAVATSTTLGFAQNDHKEKIVAAWERAKAYTKEYLDAATQEVYDFKPTPEIRSFAEQMQHLAVDNYKIVREATSQATTISNYKDIEKNQIK